MGRRRSESSAWVAEWRQSQKEAKKAAEDRKEQEAVPANVRRSRERSSMPDTLCWASDNQRDGYGVGGCKYACGGCSWSDDLIPVEGWEAIETTMANRIKSFYVLRCPQYEPHRGRAFQSPEDMDTDGAELLVQAICKKAIEDYELHQDLRPSVTNFFRGDVFSNLSDADPEYIIDMAKTAVKMRAAKTLRGMKVL